MIYPDKTGTNVMKEVGTVFGAGGGGDRRDDSRKTLGELQFQTGAATQSYPMHVLSLATKGPYHCRTAQHVFLCLTTPRACLAAPPFRAPAC